jgi:hypothetical protein
MDFYEEERANEDSKKLTLLLKVYQRPVPFPHPHRRPYDLTAATTTMLFFIKLLLKHNRFSPVKKTPADR